MAFENPWGKGSPEFNKWFNNPWEVRRNNSGGSTNSALKNTVLNWGPDQWKNSAAVEQESKPVVNLQQEPEPDWLRYTVKSGETFDFIAKKFGLDATGSDLAFWNNMKYNTDPVRAGVVLALPFKTEEDLDEIERRLDRMAAAAEENGWSVAVDNLNRFRAGTGGVKMMDVTWLKGFSEVIDAQEDIQDHFENAFNNIADDMNDGETIEGDGRSKAKGNEFWWEGKIDPSYIPVPNELSFACGASTLTGLGINKLSRTGSIVTISGEVEYVFRDEYDWHGGNSVPIGINILGFPVLFEDSDMLLLQEFRGAAPFTMKASWKQSVSGTIDDDILSPNDIEITWTDM